MAPLFLSECDELKSILIAESAQLGASQVQITRQSEDPLRQLAGTWGDVATGQKDRWNSANIPSLMGRSKQDLST